MVGQAVACAIEVSLRAQRSNLHPGRGLLRRGVHPEPVEGLLAMTESDEFSDTLLDIARSCGVWGKILHLGPTSRPHFAVYPKLWFLAHG